VGVGGGGSVAVGTDVGLAVAVIVAGTGVALGGSLSEQAHKNATTPELRDLSELPPARSGNMFVC